jgi:hypothetical protein
MHLEDAKDRTWPWEVGQRELAESRELNSNDGFVAPIRPVDRELNEWPVSG